MSLTALIRALSEAGIAPTARELAEAVWLARQVPPPPPPSAPVSTVPAPVGRQETPDGPASAPHPEPPPGLVPLGVVRATATGPPTTGHPVALPAAPGLTGPRELQKALRPFRRRAASRRHQVLDEAATVEVIASTGIWSVVQRPARERWLDVALVVDASPTMQLWRTDVAELEETLHRTGAFRDVRRWHLTLNEQGCHVAANPSAPPRSPRELIDSSGRRIVLVVTDGAAKPWHDGAASATLHDWFRAGPLAVVQVLPEELWHRTGLPTRAAVLHTSRPGAPNSQLRAVLRRRPHHGPCASVVPVLGVEPAALLSWAQLIGGGVSGLALAVAVEPAQPAAERGLFHPAEPGDELRRFRAGASPAAYQLAVCLSAVPLTLPVMRLVQHVLVPTARTSALAEIMLGGLLLHTGAEEYEFRPGVRDRLLHQLRRTEADAVLAAVGRYLGGHAGQAGRTFAGLAAVAEGPVEASTDIVTAVHPLAAARLGLADPRRADPTPSSGTPDGNRRTALLIATDRFDDDSLPNLRMAAPDLTRLAGVLGEPSAGFSVQVSLNEPLGGLRARLEAFVADSRPDETLLLYLGSHGIVDRYGRLQFGTVETRRVPADPAHPGVRRTDYVYTLSATFLARLVAEAPARQVVILVDCSHAGLFAEECKGVWDKTDELRREVRGAGTRVLIASTGPTEIAMENQNGSLFVSAAIEGLTDPKGDVDGDGAISVADLYQYVNRLLTKQQQQPRQRPLWYATGTGQILLARAPALGGRAIVRNRDERRPAGGGADQPAPVFYLSYAPGMGRERRDRLVNEQILRLFDDLCIHVSELIGPLHSQTAGFMDTPLSGESRWTDETLAALATCQVFVPLVSPALLRSPFCRIEWNTFARRPRELRTAGMPTTTSILPVLWAPVEPVEIPAALRRTSWFTPTSLPDPETVSSYQQDGLYSLLRRQDAAYQAVVWRLAQQVVRLYRDGLTVPALSLSAEGLYDGPWVEPGWRGEAERPFPGDLV
ncbi:TIR-like protein FxsC [Micromonospora sp. Mcm103]|uniref:TIR-like protein FxsC n=1 Tax=Micromonospora sp. Mcm103 TaxID=2926015 RepID=UPI0021C6320B|nr:TIR-like protein FxsC [Micromonospora sp. Mcm103]